MQLSLLVPLLLQGSAGLLDNLLLDAFLGLNMGWNPVLVKLTVLLVSLEHLFGVYLHLLQLFLLLLLFLQYRRLLSCYFILPLLYQYLLFLFFPEAGLSYLLVLNPNIQIHEIVPDFIAYIQDSLKISLGIRSNAVSELHKHIHDLDSPCIRVRFLLLSFVAEPKQVENTDQIIIY